MNNLIFEYQGKKIKRVNKSTAFKLFRDGMTIYMIPCNLSPAYGNGVFLFPVNVEARKGFYIDDLSIKNDFRNIVLSHEYYNCTTSETGYYTSFYVEL